MSKWSAIHPSVQIASTDGFRMLVFEMPSYGAMDKLASKLTEERTDPHEEFMRKLIPEGPLPRNPKDALKMYLTRTASSSFCVGNANRHFENDKAMFLAGFKSEKDMFKLLLTWPDAQQTTTWSNRTRFFVRVAKDDEFTPSENIDPAKFKSGEVL